MLEIIDECCEGRRGIGAERESEFDSFEQNLEIR